jgi:hypothetical protein
LHVAVYSNQTSGFGPFEQTKVSPVVTVAPTVVNPALRPSTSWIGLVQASFAGWAARGDARSAAIAGRRRGNDVVRGRSMGSPLPSP